MSQQRLTTIAGDGDSVAVLLWRATPKDSVDALISVAAAKGLIPEYRDLGVIPELVFMFERASKAFHGIVVQATERAARDRSPQDGHAVMRSCSDPACTSSARAFKP